MSDRKKREVVDEAYFVVTEAFLPKIVALFDEYREELDAKVCVNCSERFTECVELKNRIQKQAGAEFLGLVVVFLLKQIVYPRHKELLKKHQLPFDKKAEKRIRKDYLKKVKKVVDLWFEHYPFESLS